MILGINSDGKKLSNLDSLYEVKVPEPVGEPVIPTPTLSLSRSETTVNGTIGNTVSGATYIYKVGSAPTSETDGTVISGTSFSFTDSSALTVYVVGFMDGYADSDPASASVAQYVPAFPDTWYVLANSPFESRIDGIAYGNGRYVAIEDPSGSPDRIAYSDDGISWVFVEEHPFNIIANVYYLNGKFWIAGRDTPCIGYSDDGVNWTLSSGYPTSTLYNPNEITYGNGRYVVLCANGVVLYSDDGDTWTAITDTPFRDIPLIGNVSAFDIDYGNNMFVAVGQRGIIAYSADGINWMGTSSENYLNKTIDGVCFGDNKFVAIGNNGSTSLADGKDGAYSLTGISWIPVDTGGIMTTNAYRVIAYGNGKFVIGLTSNRISYSSDGINWTVVSIGENNELWCITYDGSKFIGGTNSGKIMYSNNC